MNVKYVVRYTAEGLLSDYHVVYTDDPVQAVQMYFKQDKDLIINPNDIRPATKKDYNVLVERGYGIFKRKFYFKCVVALTTSNYAGILG